MNDHKLKKRVEAGHETQQLRIKKECLGCGDYFTCYQLANYDYCRHCTINGNRYAQDQCSECGDGSGWVKFAKQPLRACKLCSLQPKVVQKEVNYV